MKLLPLCLALLASATFAEETPIKMTASQGQSLAIAVQPLGSFAASGERRLPAQSVVPPTQVEVVSAPLAGTVMAIRAAYGEAVKKGQALARIQGPEFLELQREYLQARAQAEVAAENRRRDESLLADGIIAGSRAATAKAADRQAQAQLSEKRQALRLAGLPEPDGNGRGLSGTTEVRAPFDGVVLDAPVQAGQRVEAATMLFKLGRLAPLWLEIQASPAQAAGLAPGDRVTVPGCKTPGKLTLVAPHMQMASQSLLLRAELQKPEGCVKPFQFMQVSIQPAKAPPGTWRVPTAALTRHQDKAWLFAEAPGGFRPVAVQVLDEASGSTGIAAAELTADTKVAVKGVASIKAIWLGLGAAE